MANLDLVSSDVIPSVNFTPELLQPFSRDKLVEFVDSGNTSEAREYAQAYLRWKIIAIIAKLFAIISKTAMGNGNSNELAANLGLKKYMWHFPDIKVQSINILLNKSQAEYLGKLLNFTIEQLTDHIIGVIFTGGYRFDSFAAREFYTYVSGPTRVELNLMLLEMAAALRDPKLLAEFFRRNAGGSYAQYLLQIDQEEIYGEAGYPEGYSITLSRKFRELGDMCQTKEEK